MHFDSGFGSLAVRSAISAAAILIVAASPAAAGVDWGRCPAPGEPGNELGPDRWYIEASSADDDLSGGKECTLRDAIESATGGFGAVYGCSFGSVGKPAADGLVAVLLPPGPYTYTLSGSELVWIFDPKLTGSQGALCGHGPQSSVIRAAASPGIAEHRVLSVGTDSYLAAYGVTIANGRITPPPPILSGGGGGGSPTGGGVLVGYPGGFFDLRHSRLVDNEAIAGGGLSCSWYGACFRLDHVEVSGNTAVEDAGGILGAGNILSSVIHDNSAGTAGGGLLSTAIEFGPPGSSSAVAGENPPLQMRNTWIHSNQAGTQGGGWLNVGGFGEVESVTISGNTAMEGGGLVLDQASDEVLNNLTVSGNSVSEPAGPALGGEGITRAGGILLINSTARIYSATITSNTHDASLAPPAVAPAGGPFGAGLLVDIGSSVLYTQSFIGGNVYFDKIPNADDCLIVTKGKPASSAGYNRVGIGCDDFGEGDGAADPADLLPLANNSGFTDADPDLDRTLPGGGFLPTHGLTADAGDMIDQGPAKGCIGWLGGGPILLATDARGFARVDGGNDPGITCDIGAFEYMANAIWIDGFELKESPCNWSIALAAACN